MLCTSVFAALKLGQRIAEIDQAGKTTRFGYMSPCFHLNSPCPYASRESRHQGARYRDPVPPPCPTSSAPSWRLTSTTDRCSEDSLWSLAGTVAAGTWSCSAVGRARSTRGRSGSLLLLRLASPSMTSRRLGPAHPLLRTRMGGTSPHALATCDEATERLVALFRPAGLLRQFLDEARA